MNPSFSLSPQLRMPTELRHVYRSLLRSSTYLPDSTARTWTNEVIKKRFRETSHKINLKIRKGIDPQPLLDRYHKHNYIAGVRRKANKLERASLGDAQALEDVLMRTYGRIGARRRQLLAQFMAPEDIDLPQDTEDLQALINGLQNNDKLEQKQYGEGSIFQALKRSQEINITSSRQSKRFKSLGLKYKIAKENIWGRPTPVKVIANLKRRLFANILDSLNPPLPVHEWDRLRGLATGILPIEESLPRRPRTGSDRFDGEENSKRLLEYFTTPVDIYRPSHNPVVTSSSGIFALHAQNSEVSTRNIHTLTPRYMCRLYARIWYITPKITRGEDNEWVVTWGSLAPFTERVAAAGWGEEELFEDLKVGDEGDSRKKSKKRGLSKDKQMRNSGEAINTGEATRQITQFGETVPRIGVRPDLR